MDHIYLDGHSTTPLAPEALEAMAPWWHERAANTHSPHMAGMLAARAVERARAELAALLNVGVQELFFTSGATEANNIAIRGTAFAALGSGDGRRRIVVSAIEHKSVLESAASLEPFGFDVVLAPVTSEGVVDLEGIAELVDERTLLVSVMAVNNEVGTVQPLSQVLEISRRAGAMIHVDAAQAASKVDLDLSDFDIASISSHKMYGPMGIGALFVSSAIQTRPMALTLGGSQEGGLRPGTVPTPLAVGFGTAAKVARGRLADDAAHSSGLLEVFLRELGNLQAHFTQNFPGATRVPGSASIRFPGWDAMSIIGKVGNRLAISEGSACNSGQIDMSHVLKAIGMPRQQASETLRLYFSRFNDEPQAVHAARVLAAAAGG